MHPFVVTLISALFLQMIVITLVQLIAYLSGTSGKLTSFYCSCNTIVVDFEKKYVNYKGWSIKNVIIVTKKELKPFF